MQKRTINQKNFKLLSREEILISLDRLTRFKHPDISYPRVFKEIIHKTSLTPHLSDKVLEEIPSKELSKYIQNVWRESVIQFSTEDEADNTANSILKDIINYSFKIESETTKELLKTKLIFSDFILKTEDKKLPLNLLIIKKTLNKIKSGEKYSKEILEKVRSEFSLLFPVKKLIIVEGITEEILIPVFADFLNQPLNKLGIYVLSAGGKTKIPALYCVLKDKLKIPAIIIFDKDAEDLSKELECSLRKYDKIILNPKGEFEDLLSLYHIKRTLNSTNYNSEKSTFNELRHSNSMCRNLEEYYRSRNLGEFKKAHFAKLLAQNLKYLTDITEEIALLINEITRM